MGGIDQAVAPDLYLGFTGGYQHSDVGEHSASSGTVDTARAAVYGGGWWGPNLLTPGRPAMRMTGSPRPAVAGVGTARQAHGGDELTLARAVEPAHSNCGIGGEAVMTPKLGCLPYCTVSVEVRAGPSTPPNLIDHCATQPNLPADELPSSIPKRGESHATIAEIN